MTNSGTESDCNLEDETLHKTLRNLSSFFFCFSTFPCLLFVVSLSLIFYLISMGRSRAGKVVYQTITDNKVHQVRHKYGKGATGDENEIVKHWWEYKSIVNRGIGGRKTLSSLFWSLRTRSQISHFNLLKINIFIRFLFVFFRLWIYFECYVTRCCV